MGRRAPPLTKSTYYKWLGDGDLYEFGYIDASRGCVPLGRGNWKAAFAFVWQL
jgi:hypothetical protein